MKRTWTFLLFIALSLLLQDNFLHNRIATGPPGMFERFQDDSQRLVLNKLRTVLHEGFWSGGFFLYKDDGTPYTAQIGAQGFVLSLLFAAFHPQDPGQMVRMFEWFVAMLFALTLVGFVFFAGKRFGWVVGAALCVQLYASDWITIFARNLYWVVFTLFLPYLFSWWAYERMVTEKTAPKFFYAFLMLLVFCRTLCGYEYVTNLVAAPGVAAIYYIVRRGGNFGAVIRGLIPIAVFGSLGFGLALALHLVQGLLLRGSFFEATQMILGPALYRTYGYGGEAVYDQAATKSIVQVVGEYLNLFAASPFTIWHFVLASLLVAAIAAMMHVRRKASSDVVAMAYATLAALCASLTWAFAAKGHMFFHLHINGIIFYLPFLMTAYLLIGILLRDVLALTKSTDGTR